MEGISITVFLNFSPKSFKPECFLVDFKLNWVWGFEDDTLEDVSIFPDDNSQPYILFSVVLHLVPNFWLFLWLKRPPINDKSQICFDPESLQILLDFLQPKYFQLLEVLKLLRIIGGSSENTNLGFLVIKLWFFIENTSDDNVVVPRNLEFADEVPVVQLIQFFLFWKFLVTEYCHVSIRF